MDNETLKRQAAEAAYAHIMPGEWLGVGTGSTVDCFIDLLAEKRPFLHGCISSSETTTKRLRAAGFEVEDLNMAGDIPVYIDGADEANKQLQLIKGGGGALTREKVIAGAARKFVCIADASKRVDVLGDFPLPVEVIPMARSFVGRQLVKMGGHPEWREDFVTDNGNPIIDVYSLDILDPVAMEDRINAIPGVVTVGLFARRPADQLIIASDDGVETLTR